MGSFIMSDRRNRVKKSFILSGLVGTGGFFLSKLIGLLYAIPFSKILGSDAYMSYYGTAYRIYSYVLNVFTAGMPLAITAIVAKYMAREDYKSVQLIKKIAFYILLATGFVGMVLMIIVAYFIAPSIAVKNDETIVMITLCILSVAIFFVPILSWIRGYYQGQKEIQQYAFSQAFEQFFRVGFLLACSMLAVYVLHMERKWALYIAVASTSVAAIAAIMQFYFFDQKHKGELSELVHTQTSKAEAKNKLTKELVLLAVPYLIQAILGYSDDIIYSTILPGRLRAYGYDEESLSVILSSFNYVGVKLNSIPMILAPGFISAIIPHISEALEKKDTKKIEKNIRDAFNTVLYIGTPIAFCIFLYAKGLYNTLFYTDNLELSAASLRFVSVEGFLGVIAPVVSATMMALHLRKSIIRNQVVNVILKVVLLFPLVAWLGYPGIIISASIGALYLVIFSMLEIKNKFKISFNQIIKNFAIIIVGLCAMALSYWLLCKIGLDPIHNSKMIGFVKMIANGLITVLVYIGVTWIFHIPQKIFHIKGY